MLGLLGMPCRRRACAALLALAVAAPSCVSVLAKETAVSAATAAEVAALDAQVKRHRAHDAQLLHADAAWTAAAAATGKDGADSGGGVHLVTPPPPGAAAPAESCQPRLAADSCACASEETGSVVHARDKGHQFQLALSGLSDAARLLRPDVRTAPACQNKEQRVNCTQRVLPLRRGGVLQQRCRTDAHSGVTASVRRFRFGDTLLFSCCQAPPGDTGRAAVGGVAGA